MSVAYVIGTYPLLTTTFIDREVERLRAMGVTIDVVSIRRPEGLLSVAQQRLAGSVRYVLPVSKLALVAALARASLRPTFWHTMAQVVTQPHPQWRARLKSVAHVALGAVVAARLRASAPERVHAHFVDRAAVVAMTTARLLGVPYSATAHANDIYVDPVLLPFKVAQADFVATCTGFNLDHLRRTLGQESERVALVYHGLSVTDYHLADPAAEGTPTLLAVGQLKAKKGYDLLLGACAALLASGRVFRCEIIGEGPERDRLESLIDSHDLGEVVALRGALPHEQVADSYRRAAAFVLPCRTTADGDRDGIPNVILEAMASGLPVVSTRHSGVPEAVDDEVSGLLVEPDDVEGLTKALARLIDDPALRAEMGAAGRRRALIDFDLDTNTSALHARLVPVAELGAGGLPQLGDRGLFVVWGPPNYGPRSRVLAEALGMPVRFVEITKRRGGVAALVKYPGQTIATLALLARRRPKVVFVQSPPNLAVLVVALYAAVSRARYVIDGHSDAFMSPIWSRPRWLNRGLARRALVTIVTNEHFAAEVVSWGGRALIVRDVPATYPETGTFGPAQGLVDGGFNVTVVSTFAADEPFAEVLDAACRLPDVTFHVTGDPARCPGALRARAPENVRFTGFLSRDDYYTLMRASQAVLCLTTRDHTMQRGACEALALGVPIITSDWPLLRSYFDRGTVHVDNSAESIHHGVLELVRGHDRYVREIGALQLEQQRRWEQAGKALTEWLVQGGQPGQG